MHPPPDKAQRKCAVMSAPYMAQLRQQLEQQRRELERASERRHALMVRVASLVLVLRVTEEILSNQARLAKAAAALGIRVRPFPPDEARRVATVSEALACPLVQRAVEETTRHLPHLAPGREMLGIDEVSEAALPAVLDAIQHSQPSTGHAAGLEAQALVAELKEIEGSAATRGGSGGGGQGAAQRAAEIRARLATLGRRALTAFATGAAFDRRTQGSNLGQRAVPCTVEPVLAVGSLDRSQDEWDAILGGLALTREQAALTLDVFELMNHRLQELNLERARLCLDLSDLLGGGGGASPARGPGGGPAAPAGSSEGAATTSSSGGTGAAGGAASPGGLASDDPPPLLPQDAIAEELLANTEAYGVAMHLQMATQLAVLTDEQRACLLALSHPVLPNVGKTAEAVRHALKWNPGVFLSAEAVDLRSQIAPPVALAAGAGAAGAGSTGGS